MKKSILLILCLIYSLINYSQINENNSIIFITHLSNSEFPNAYSHFDTIIKEQLALKTLGATWNELQKQVGTYKSYSTITTEKEGEYQIVFVACQFKNEDLDLKLIFNNKSKIVGFFFVPPQPKAVYNIPTYDKANKYIEMEITIQTGGYSLPAILTLPKNKKNLPILILVHGSGPNDKDETIGPNKIFRDLAVGLASNGIATIRYDKRTKVYAEKLNEISNEITVKEETIEDAISAINIAKEYSEIDKSKIYLLGHSLGGMLAPRIAQVNSDLKGIILLAGNARPLEDLILEQIQYILSIDGLTSAEQQQIDELTKQIKKVKSNELDLQTSKTELPLNVPASYWIDLKKYNQVETAKQLKQSILILQGERDYQVTMADFTTWKKELNNNKTIFISYPKLNHLFIEGVGQCIPSEYEKQGNVSEDVINDITKWIKEN